LPTPRKKRSTTPFGPRVTDDSERGRPAHGIDFAAAVAQRVRGVRKRLSAPPAEPVPEWERLTRRRFSERIGMSEAALAGRLRMSSPTLFSAQELATICVEFRVRPEYLLLGQEPMLQDDIVVSASLEQVAPALRRHLARILGTRLKQEAEWVESYLGESAALLEAIEAGVGDALSESFQNAVADRKLASKSVREAVAMRAREAAPVPTVPDDFFTVASAGLRDGTLIDPGASDEPPQPADPLVPRVEELKPLAEVGLPDWRRNRVSILNHATGEIRPMKFEDHYRAIASITLAESVPGTIQTLFNTARNVLVYSWQVYRFTVVAELQAYSTLEFALRDRLGIGGNFDGPGLAKLLRRAAKEGVLTDEAFVALRSHPCWPVVTGNSFIDANTDPDVVSSRGHVAILAQVLPMLRNTLAHGSSSVWPDAFATFWVVAAAINWMYTPRT
jgi:transcriptional regulator with XRE-family HTH domain